MRRGVYLLLTVFLVQLSGLRAALRAEPPPDARVLPDEHQDNTAQFILTAGLLHNFYSEFPGINRRDPEY